MARKNKQLTIYPDPMARASAGVILTREKMR